RPEFLNRLDDVILFHALGKDQIERIVDLQIALLAERLEKRELSLDVSKVARQKVADMGYDPLYGARPLNRVLQREDTDRVARAVLEGRFTKRDPVRVDVKNDTFVVEAGPNAAATQPRAQA